MKYFQINILILLEAFLFIYLSFSTVHDWNNDVVYAQYPVHQWYKM